MRKDIAAFASAVSRYVTFRQRWRDLSGWMLLLCELWAAISKGKSGTTPVDLPTALQRLGVDVRECTGLVCDSGQMFSWVAGLPGTLTNL